MAKLDRRLNLVLSVTTDDGAEMWVHHTPIRREVFQTHFLVITKTVSAMYEEGLPPNIASRVAMLMLRKVAKDMGTPIPEQVEQALLPELWRLTNVMIPNPNGAAGWLTVPLEKVIADKVIDEEDAEEVKNHVVFFTCASWVHKKNELEEMIYPILQNSGSQITSLNSTDFRPSSPTSTPVENTGETATASSIPS
jgi:hypothetical protein